VLRVHLETARQSDTWLMISYLIQVTILAAACFYITVNPRFRQPKLRPYRAAMYTGLGFSALIFITHGLVIHGWEVQNRRMSLSWMGLMAGFNLIGAAAYAFRVSLTTRSRSYTDEFQVPERWYPRRYDIYGSSHQILHFLVILAGLMHMFGLFSAFDFVHKQAQSCVSHNQKVVT
jgi:adiponectin receptor